MSKLTQEQEVWYEGIMGCPTHDDYDEEDPIEGEEEEQLPDDVELEEYWQEYYLDEDDRFRPLDFDE